MLWHSDEMRHAKRVGFFSFSGIIKSSSMKTKFRDLQYMNNTYFMIYFFQL